MKKSTLEDMINLSNTTITGPDPFTGLYAGSNGGTELLYRALTERLPSELLEGVQLICSRPNMLMGKPRILWQHDHFSDPPPHYEDAEYRKLFAKHVFVSHIQQMLFVNRIPGMSYDETTVIRNAIVPIAPHTKPTGRINLIYHTTPHRGLELLVPAFIEVAKANPNISMHLDVYSSFNAYGWSNRDVPFEPLFEMCRQHPQITYHGFQSNAVIRDALTKAHIFAYPNIWPETSCLAAMEAMSAGCLVICPKHEGLIETVGDHGITYPYTDDGQTHINKFANILHQVVNEYSKSVFVSKVNMASRYINTYYSWDTRLPEWINLIEGVIKNGQSSQEARFKVN